MSIETNQNGPSESIRMITVSDLARRFGGTESWWERRRAALVSAGLLHKIGRRFFGSMSEIEHALRDPAALETQ